MQISPGISLISSYGRGPFLPKVGLLAYWRPAVDIIGVSRTLQNTQYLDSDGTGTGSHIDLTTTCTINSSGGASVLSITTAGQLDFAIGTAWDISITFDDATTSLYPFGDTTTGVIWDVSGNGRHLVIGGTLTTEEDPLCETGSDWLNLYGLTVADGSQYLSPVSFGLIPDSVIIPVLVDKSGCCVWEVV